MAQPQYAATCLADAALSWHETLAIPSMYMLTLQQTQYSNARCAFSNPLGVRSCAPSVILVLAICRPADCLSRAARDFTWCRRLVSAQTGKPSGGGITSHAAGACLNRGRALAAMAQGASCSIFSGKHNQHSCCLCCKQCRWYARGSCIEAQCTCVLMGHSLVLCSPV